MEFKNIEVSHLQHALRGMRNAMSGWDKSDTITVVDDHLHTHDIVVGTSDRDLVRRLIKAGAPHRKFMRQISVIVDICKMPAYFMHEFATYKVGTTADSSSTQHKITSRPLTRDDFEDPETESELIHLADTIEALNNARANYLSAKNAGDNDRAEKLYDDRVKQVVPNEGWLVEDIAMSKRQRTETTIVKHDLVDIRWASRIQWFLFGVVTAMTILAVLDAVLRPDRDAAERKLRAALTEYISSGEALP